MASATCNVIKEALTRLREAQQYRSLPSLKHQGRYVNYEGTPLLNIASNDYLGIGSDASLQTEFLSQLPALTSAFATLPKMGSTSSRLLTGNDYHLQALEDELQQWYQLAKSSSSAVPQYKSALVLNSGYHANMGLLPALAALPINTVIVADKWVHASMIDGIRLSQNKHCTFKRYRHNDYAHLSSIIERLEDSIERIIIVTESIFSMDGDRANLSALVALKKSDPRIELYIDEAHAVGILGVNGLGLAEETETLADIDYLIGTFGKAFASMGAYIFCDAEVKEWLINQTRTLIFSTALPPITHAWTRFVLAKMPALAPVRDHLVTLSTQVAQHIQSSYTSYQSPIIPYIVGDNASAIAKAEQLRQAGFYALPIRPPTVPINTSRIRLVINAGLTLDECDRLIAQL